MVEAGMWDKEREMMYVSVQIHNIQRGTKENKRVGLLAFDWGKVRKREKEVGRNWGGVLSERERKWESKSKRDGESKRKKIIS